MCVIRKGAHHFLEMALTRRIAWSILFVAFPLGPSAAAFYSAGYVTRSVNLAVARALVYRKHAYRKRNTGGQSLKLYSSLIDDYRLKDDIGPLDFGVTDSLDVPDYVRPSLAESVANPRDLLALALLACGSSVAYHNIFGIYGQSYEFWQRLAILLGVINSASVAAQLQTSYMISKRPRLGVVDDAALHLYAGLYSGAASWLALRTSTFCPPWLIPLDRVLPCLAAAIFAYSLAAPAVTLYDNMQQSSDEDGVTTLSSAMVRAARGSAVSVPTSLSETELFRANGLLFIGVLGCVFVPACLAFALKGDDWWQRVGELHSKQRLLESTDALFALFATEASMIATRAANAGVAPYKKTVPVFAAVCLLLALVPCACSLWWLGGGDDISFFSFYSE